MKQILIDLDELTARDLERVAPVKTRKRAEFIRLAIRGAIDRVLDRATASAYTALPAAAEVTAADLQGWDAHNELARAAIRPRKRSPRRAPPRTAA